MKKYQPMDKKEFRALCEKIEWKVDNKKPYSIL